MKHEILSRLWWIAVIITFARNPKDVTARYRAIEEERKMRENNPNDDGIQVAPLFIALFGVGGIIAALVAWGVL